MGHTERVRAPVTAQPRSALAYEALRSDILAGRLRPGDRLGFTLLRERFGGSMSTIREALTRLVEQGLVESERQVGFRVVTISVEDLIDLTEARQEMEGLALELALRDGSMEWETSVVATHHALERTRAYAQDDHARFSEGWAQAHADFHNALLSGCGNRRILEAALSMRDAAELYRRWSVPLGKDHGRDIAAEHEGLMRAAVSRNATAARSALTTHIQRTTDKLIPVLAETEAT